MNQSTNILKNLSLEEKIGQLFFIGLSGEELSATDEKLLKDIKPGGICLFSRNIKDAEKTRRLLFDISERLPLQPFLSLDQEGGLVDRLRRIVEPFPSAAEISRNGNFGNAKKLAALTGEILRILGFNMNFAPVVDVGGQKRADFVMNNQARLFGQTKAEVFEWTGIYLETLQNSGIIGCLKHFPGIGAVEFDPHIELPSVKLKHEEFYEIDLFPFTEHFKNKNVYAVMTGHITFPLNSRQEFDSGGKLLPASLSQNFITQLLRKELGFQGLALTDDLEMGAIVENYGIGEAAKMAFLAGSDFLLICNNPEAVFESYEAILAANKAGEISEARIDESLERISRVRNLLQKPLHFRQHRLDELSLEIKELKVTL
jgi:beta-N-acetylhexosaminidase